ncbi:MAG TPA: hypothetical protein VK753_02930 [Xanthomonadaceae bacterium]|nr:hypothetical protein [Xanthomonadaceae bacterium]
MIRALAFSRWPFLAVALLAGAGACAKPLDIVGTHIDLPFAFDIQHSTEELSDRGGGFASMQQVQIVVTDGPAKGEKMSVFTVYVLPKNADASAMQKEQQALNDKADKEPGVRSSSSIEIDGFDFHFIDGPIKDKTYPEAIQIAGLLGTSALHIEVLAEDTRPLTPPLAAAIKAIHPDYGVLLKGKSLMDGESAVSVHDHLLQTPLGNVTLDADVVGKLSDSLVQHDSTGQVGFRHRTFDLFESGLKNSQGIRITMGCGKLGALMPDDYRKFLDMSTELENPDASQRPSDVKTRPGGTLLGLAAESTTANGLAVDPWHLIHNGVERWAARKDDLWYMVTATRGVKASPLLDAIMKQLASAPTVCQLDLPLGMPASAASAPAASPAATSATH